MHFDSRQRLLTDFGGHLLSSSARKHLEGTASFTVCKVLEAFTVDVIEELVSPSLALVWMRDLQLEPLTSVPT